MEGAFYLWTADEVRQLLPETSRYFELRYGVLPNGNAPFDPQQEFDGKNILYTARSIADIARETGAEAGRLAAALLDARGALFQARESRPRPERDDKVLTAWNGLMIAAAARAARILDGGEALEQTLTGENPGSRHLRAARRAAAFLQRELWDADRRLLRRRYRGGKAAIEGFSEDYAYLIWGLLELFQSSGEAEWLEWAIVLQERQDALFADTGRGGWFSTTGQDPHVLVRAKEEYDGAEPSATSVSAHNTLVLAHLTGDSGWRAQAEAAITSFGGRLRSQGRGVPLMAAALAVSLTPGEQLVVVGPRDREDTQRLWRQAQRRFRPFAVLVPVEPGAAQEALSRRLPWIGDMTMRDGRATAYHCRDFVCSAPTIDPEALL